GVGKVRLRVREYDGAVQLGASNYSAPVALTGGLAADRLGLPAGAGPYHARFPGVRRPGGAGRRVPDGQPLGGDRSGPGKFGVEGRSAREAGAPGLEKAEGGSAGGAIGDGRIPVAALAPLTLSITPHPVARTSEIRFATSRRGPL